MTMQEPVKQVQAIEVVIRTVLIMIQTTIYPMLPTVDVLLTRKMHHRCPETLSSTIDISATELTKPAEMLA